MEGEDVEGAVPPERERNYARYLLCLNTCKEMCLKETYCLLFHSWGGGPSYASLMDFCVEALGWRKENIFNLFSRWDGDESVSSPFSLAFPNSLHSQGTVRGIDGGLFFPVPPTASCAEDHLMKPHKSPFQRSYTTSVVTPSQSLRHPAARPRRNTMFIRPVSRNYAESRASFWESRSSWCKSKESSGHKKSEKHQRDISRKCTQISGYSLELVSAPDHGKIVTSSHERQDAPARPQGPGQVLNTSPSALLKVVPDPSYLSENMLVFMLTEVFPQMPTRLQKLIARLRRLSRTVCYLDVAFGQLQLETRVQDLLELMGEIVNVVLEACSKVITEKIAVMVKKLKMSKKQYTQSKKEYKEHMNLVTRTREELDEAQRELQHAQLKDREVKKNIRYLWARSYSRESQGGSVKGVSNGTSKNLPERESISSVAYVSKAAFHGDSGSTSLADEGDMGGNEVDTHDSGLEGSNVSLLTSVMKEVAVIERRHSTAEDVNHKLQRVLRSNRQSVLLTKKQMCQRLGSNVSAEQECIAKEDILTLKRVETAKLKDTLKKLKKNCNSLKTDGSSLISRMAAATDIILNGKTEEDDIPNGLAEIHSLRGDTNNKLLMEARQEAVSFASRMKVFSVQEWLARRQYAKHEVKSGFSNLKVKGSKETRGILDLLNEDDNAASVIVISGPKGSGKTCLCHHILHQWKSNDPLANSKLRETDIVIYATLSDIISSGSWAQYLREHVLCYSLKDYTDSTIHEELRNMNVLFLLDAVGAAGDVDELLEEILKNLGHNRLVVTTRSGNEKELEQRVSAGGVKCVLAEICPMTPQAVSEYAAQYFLLTDNPKTSHQDKVRQFMALFSSMTMNDTVLYPLPVTYLLYLWSIDPTQVLFSTSVSSLFSRVVTVCQHRLTEVLKSDGGGDRGTARLTVDENLHLLYRTTKELMTNTSWPHTNQVLLEADHCLFKDPRVLLHLSPLVLVKEGTDGNKHGFLVHPSLADVLCGFFFANTLLLKARRKTLVFRRPKLSNLHRYDPKILRDVLLHVAGSFIDSKHSLGDATDLVALYQKSLHDNGDMLAWLDLLRECNFTKNVCDAVSLTLSSVATWVVSRHSSETNCVVAELLRRGAYRPKLVVVVTPDARDKEREKSVHSIIHALGTCPNTMVRLRQESQFYTWGNEKTCDDLVSSLQPPGTLQECWGHLGTEGALAIRHSHHLEELNVRISSIEALTALTHSINSQRRSLRYLYLRLDLPTSIPVSSFQPISFKGKEFWLRLRGINDDSESWVRDVTKKLNNWYSEVVLEESQLSPSVLHELKQFMSRTPLHVSE